eukprot:1919978-Amphidinium_carterae.1
MACIVVLSLATPVRRCLQLPKRSFMGSSVLFALGTWRSGCTIGVIRSKLSPIILKQLLLLM